MENIALSDYKIASEIFYKLLRKGELKEKGNKELFLAYINNDGIRKALECISDASKCKILIVSDTLYLIPNEDNDIMGFDYRQDSSFARSEKECYLAYLIMTIIFAEFTNEYCKTAYILVMDILQLVEEAISRAAARSDVKELEQKHAFNILTIKDLWDSKDSWNENSKRGKFAVTFDCKIGIIRKVISFLVKEKLLIYIQDEDKIITSERFDNLMNGYFLDEDRKQLIEEIFLGKDDLNASI